VPCESSFGDVEYDRVEGAAKETAREALPYSLVAVSETDRPHRQK